MIVPQRRLESVQLNLEAAVKQAPPLVVAAITGTETLLTVEGTPPTVAFRGNSTPFSRTLELQLDRGRYVIVGARGGTPRRSPPAPPRSSSPRVSVVFASRALLRRSGSTSPAGHSRSGRERPRRDDGRRRLLGRHRQRRLARSFAVNSYSYLDQVTTGSSTEARPEAHSSTTPEEGSPTSAARHGADVQIPGNGCVAGDFNGDGFSDLYVTASGYDALLWNDGKGHFTEGARAAGITAWGWHTGATVGDVNGDGRPDIFVAGYADLNAPVSSASGFPNNYLGVPDLLYLNTGNDQNGHARFREIGVKARIDTRSEHGLGAVFSDMNGDGRLDLYVANDANPNRLYLNTQWPGGVKADPLGLGFRLEERATQAGIADPNAGMGIAAADYSGDGRTDLVVTNSHKQLHGVFRSGAPAHGAPSFSDARSDIAPAFDTSLAGWGTSWVDLDNDGNLDLVLANGAIPVAARAKSAEPVQAFENLTRHGHPGQFAAASSVIGLGAVPHVNGRGLAAADFDNDGNVDVAVNTINGKLLLLRNTGAKANWLEVELDRFAPGALVTAVLPDGRRLVQELHAGSSYLSSEDPRAHFGLGKAKTVDELVVRYPEGRITSSAGSRQPDPDARLSGQRCGA